MAAQTRGAAQTRAVLCCAVSCDMIRCGVMPCDVMHVMPFDVMLLHEMWYYDDVMQSEVR